MKYEETELQFYHYYFFIQFIFLINMVPLLDWISGSSCHYYYFVCDSVKNASEPAMRKTRRKACISFWPTPPTTHAYSLSLSLIHFSLALSYYFPPPSLCCSPTDLLTIPWNLADNLLPFAIAECSAWNILPNFYMVDSRSEDFPDHPL